MNPWHLNSSELLIWGIVIHFIADWLLQTEWMAVNKMKRKQRPYFPSMRGEDAIMYQGYWWDRHPAAYVHAGIHLALLSPLFGWAAFPIAVVHFFIDLRFPVAWWTHTLEQTQPGATSWDMGDEVRIWVDQVFHIVTIAIAALIVVSV